MLGRIDYESSGMQTFLLGIGIAEIDKIMVDRICCSLIARSVPKISELECCKVINDEISKLPDEILCSIISLLTTREAARTSILSKRWKDLWRKTLNLNFDIVNKCGYEYFRSKLREDGVELLMQTETPDFLSWVDEILLSLHNSIIETFRLRHCLGKEHTHHIDNWLQFAVDRKVQNVDFDFSKFYLLSVGHEPYSFPCGLFVEGRGSSLKHLSLKYCSLCTPLNFGSFKFLVSLNLREVFLTQGNFEVFLTGCISLEWLSLTHCRCPFILKVVGSCLKHLSISFCYGLKAIEIDAINLVSYELRQRGSIFQFPFKQIPQSLVRSCCFLVEKFSLSDALGKVERDFPSLETLHLITPLVKEKFIRPNTLPTFTKLKKLELSITNIRLASLLPLSSLLEVSPVLHKLELHLNLHTDEDGSTIYRKKKSRRPHNHLKEVQIYGFQGHRVDLELAIYLLNNAIFLEKMELNTSLITYVGDGEYFIYDGERTRIPTSRIYRKLRKRSPSNCTARVVVLQPAHGKEQ